MSDDFITILRPTPTNDEDQGAIDFLLKHWRKFFFFALAPLMLIAPWMFALGYISYVSIRDYPDQVPFDSSKWKDKALVESESRIRIHMIDDLMKNYKFEGMSKTEVINMLGEPDKNQEFPEWDMVYWLGPERSPFGIDSEWLAIRFDDQQQVSECKVITD